MDLRQLLDRVLGPVDQKKRWRAARTRGVSVS